MIVIAGLYQSVVGVLARLQLHPGEVLQLILNVGTF